MKLFNFLLRLGHAADRWNHERIFRREILPQLGQPREELAAFVESLRDSWNVVRSAFIEKIKITYSPEELENILPFPDSSYYSYLVLDETFSANHIPKILSSKYPKNVIRFWHYLAIMANFSINQETSNIFLRYIEEFNNIESETMAEGEEENFDWIRDLTEALFLYIDEELIVEDQPGS